MKKTMTLHESPAPTAMSTMSTMTLLLAFELGRNGMGEGGASQANRRWTVFI